MLLDLVSSSSGGLKGRADVLLEADDRVDDVSERSSNVAFTLRRDTDPLVSKAYATAKPLSAEAAACGHRLYAEFDANYSALVPVAEKHEEAVVRDRDEARRIQQRRHEVSCGGSETATSSYARRTTTPLAGSSQPPGRRISICPVTTGFGNWAAAKDLSEIGR